IEWIWRTVTGTSTRRTITTSATIDHAQEKPAVVWSHSRRFVRKSSIGRSGLTMPTMSIMSAPASPVRAAGTAFGRRRDRHRRGSTGCSGGAAKRRGSRRGRARPHGTRRARTGSSSGGTCTFRLVSAGRACAARRRRSRCRSTSCVHLADHLAHLLDEPLVAAALGRLGETRSRREDVVPPGRDVGPELDPDGTELALETVARDSRSDGARDREAEPWEAVRVLVAGEPVQRQRARRDRPPLTVDGVEVTRPGQALPALHGAGSGGEALPPLGAAALEDRLPAAGRHARTKPVLALGGGRSAGTCASRRRGALRSNVARTSGRGGARSIDEL